MPQGEVITVRPNNFMLERAIITPAENQETGFEGEVKILDGEFAGMIGHFIQQGNNSHLNEGKNVDIEVIGEEDGKIKVDIR